MAPKQKYGRGRRRLKMEGVEREMRKEKDS
jgi:hypothetical protein